MKYIARKPFRYGTGVYMTGQEVPVDPEDVRTLQARGKIGGQIRESAIKRPPENAMKPKAEPLNPLERAERVIPNSESVKPDYNKLTVAKLKDLCEEKGLSTEGRKAELIERLSG